MKNSLESNAFVIFRARPGVSAFRRVFPRRLVRHGASSGLTFDQRMATQPAGRSTTPRAARSDIIRPPATSSGSAFANCRAAELRGWRLL